MAATLPPGALREGVHAAGFVVAHVDAEAIFQALLRVAAQHGAHGLLGKLRPRDLVKGEQPALVEILIERALFGLARSEETLSTGDLESAIDAYQKLLDEFPDSVYQESATKRIAQEAAGLSL